MYGSETMLARLCTTMGDQFCVFLGTTMVENVMFFLTFIYETEGVMVSLCRICDYNLIVIIDELINVICN